MWQKIGMIISIVFFTLPSSVLAKEYTLGPEAKIRAQLSQQFVGLPIDDVRPVMDGGQPVKSLYHVQSGSRIFYVTADARYIISGDLLSLENSDPQAPKRNLTDEARKAYRLKILTPEKFTESMVYAPQGKQKAILTVFSDIDCGHCQEFHKQIPILNQAGIAVRYLSFPRAGIDSESFKKAVTVRCAADPLKKMDEYMNGKGTAVDAELNPACIQKVREEMQLGMQLGLQGTPTLLFENGNLIPGYMPAEALIGLLLPSENSTGK